MTTSASTAERVHPLDVAAGVLVLCLDGRREALDGGEVAVLEVLRAAQLARVAVAQVLGGGAQLSALEVAVAAAVSAAGAGLRRRAPAAQPGCDSAPDAGSRRIGGGI